MRKLSALLLIFPLFLGCRSNPVSPDNSLPPTPTVQNAVFVSVSGHDGNDGRSRENAVRTIQRALALIKAGDTILVTSGVYNQQVEIRNRDSSVPVRIQGEAGAILDGGRQLRFGIRIRDSADVQVSFLEIANYSDSGIAAWYSNRVEFKNLRVHDNGFRNQSSWSDGEGYGIDIQGCRNVLVEGNEAYANGPEPAIRNRGIMGTGINTWGNHDIVIRSNRSHHNIGGGILVEDSTQVLVVSNIVSDNDVDVSAFDWWDAGIWLDGGSDVIIRDNVFTGNLGPGIQISNEEGANPRGYVVEGNTSTRNYFGILMRDFGVCPFPSENILRLNNNNFTGNTRKDIFCQPR